MLTNFEFKSVSELFTFLPAALFVIKEKKCCLTQPNFSKSLGGTPRTPYELVPMLLAGSHRQRSCAPLPP